MCAGAAIIEPQVIARAGGWLYVTGDMAKFQQSAGNAVEVVRVVPLCLSWFVRMVC